MTRPALFILQRDDKVPRWLQRTRSESADKPSMPPWAALCPGRAHLLAPTVLTCDTTCGELQPRHGTPADGSSKALPACIPGDSSEGDGLGLALGAPPGLLLDAEVSIVER